MPAYGTIDHDYGAALATSDEGPVYMLNLMKYRSEAEYGTDGERGVSGREADDRYAPVDVLRAIGAAIVFVGEVVSGSEDWDRVAVVRYATRRSFVDMQTRPDFQDKHVHKEAGMDHTIVMGTVPRDGVPAAVGQESVLLEVWDGDDPVPSAGGPSSTFTVEGTIIGDGRRWTGARWTVVADEVDLSPARRAHQLIRVDPVVERWS